MKYSKNLILIYFELISKINLFKLKKIKLKYYVNVNTCVKYIKCRF